MTDLVRVLNTAISSITLSELLERLHPRQGGFVVTPNVDHLAKLQKDLDFYYAYQEADYRVCDSQILLFLGRLFGYSIKEKITGSDLLPAFYEYYRKDESVRIFLLGGPPGAAAKAQEVINRKVGRAMVVGHYCPPFGFEHDEAECRNIIECINQSRANVLAVGLGAPKQEKWMFKHRTRMFNIRTAFAIGAAIEFQAGTLPRAPRWMSNFGLEWLYRIIKDPKRLWNRYLIESLPVFKCLMLERIGAYQNPFKADSIIIESNRRNERQRPLRLR
jgi:exopolysaccharide biosynthesis WecB/TagA/CpsF family protein